MSGDPSRVERYLAHLDVLSGGVEPQFWPVESTWPGHHGVTAIGYRDMPDDGLLLGFTYGLSLSQQDEWRYGRPELSICVRSKDAAWVLAIAHLAERLRHDCPFTYGDTINFGEPIAQDSPMDGFVVSAPIALDAADAHIELGDDLPVHVVGMYPTYDSERRFVSQHGLEAFWKRDWDPYDVTRPPAA
jgi:hypothetical protein